MNYYAPIPEQQLNTAPGSSPPTNSIAFIGVGVDIVLRFIDEDENLYVAVVPRVVDKVESEAAVINTYIGSMLQST